jgi:predicted nuclease of predicted toxin-antitoxin system
MRLLLDIHISPVVAQTLATEDIDIVSLRDWRDKRFRGSADEEILSVAYLEGRVLVTYDKHTIPDILAALGAAGRSHAGVVLVDKHTVSQRDIGGLIRAIRALAIEQGDADWTGRLDYLRRYRD